MATNDKNYLPKGQILQPKNLHIPASKKSLNLPSTKNLPPSYNSILYPRLTLFLSLALRSGPCGWRSTERPQPDQSARGVGGWPRTCLTRVGVDPARMIYTRGAASSKMESRERVWPRELVSRVSFSLALGYDVCVGVASL